MSATVEAIWRYPVKSLGGEALAEAALSVGHGVAHDRRYALVPAAAGEPVPGWRPKSKCLALVRHAAMARFGARYDEASGALTIASDGKDIAKVQAGTAAGRGTVEAMLDLALAPDVGTRMMLTEASPGGMMTDVDQPFVSLINLASIRALEKQVAATVDPVRFRANFYFDGIAAWTERAWPGKRVAIGDAVIEVMEPINRCAATEVNPTTAERDIRVLRGLSEGFDHVEMGIYAKVVAGGKVARGAALRALD